VLGIVYLFEAVVQRWRELQHRKALASRDEQNRLPGSDESSQSPQ
jgi:hypothetical protein